jgi:hypothetical protein
MASSVHIRCTTEWMTNRDRISAVRISKSQFIAGVLLLVLSITLPALALHESDISWRSSNHSSYHSRTYSRSHHRSSSRVRSHNLSHHSRRASSSVKRDAHVRIRRSAAAKHSFERQHPCPSTGRSSGRCPGYVVDHVRPLECGGADAPSNMQWQTVAAGKA